MVRSLQQSTLLLEGNDCIQQDAEIASLQSFSHSHWQPKSPAMRNILKKLSEMLEIGVRATTPQPEANSNPPMDDVAFWYIINRCNHLSSSNERYYNMLWSMLSDVDAVSVSEFAVKVEEMRKLLQSWNIWAVANLIFPGLTVDALHGFQNWIISAGKEAYLNIVEHEDNIADVLRVAGHRDLVFESFDRIPGEVLSQKPGGGQSVLVLGRSLDQAVLQGEHWELTEANLTSRFPKLSAMLGRSPDAVVKPLKPTVH
jgi:Protein of unknown function (DUF4240)